MNIDSVVYSEDGHRSDHLILDVLPCSVTPNSTSVSYLIMHFDISFCTTSDNTTIFAVFWVLFVLAFIVIVIIAMYSGYSVIFM